ncbi:MAG: LTA synthase family protein [Bacteriovoracaceae bacterium]
MDLTFRHFYWRWIKNLAIVFVFFAILLTVARAGFVVFFGDLDSLLTQPGDLLKAFYLGLRFDLIPLAYINALPFLILNFAYFFSGKKLIAGVRVFLTYFLLVFYLILIWIYVCDYGFYSYFQDHINILFFGLFEDDTKAVLISIWKNYNVPVWLGILFILHYAFYRLIKFFFSQFEFDLKAHHFDYRAPVILVVGVVLLAFLGRGNFTRVPLSFEDAHISSNEFINKIPLNGVISLNRAIKIRKTFGKDNFDYLKDFKYSNWTEAYVDAFAKSSDQQDFGHALISKTPENKFLKENPPHVVLIIMESFGSYWNEEDSEDFQLLGELKNHFQSGLLFKNFLSAENGTIGSTVSVSVSQVIRPGARFLSESEYMNTFLSSAGHLPFKEQSYETHFVYGGKLGWRDLGRFLSTQRYDRLWGADEIKEHMPELNQLDSRELGNEWGIFDEYLYSFIGEKLRTATRPQFFLVLTTSNHPPFEFPTNYKPLPVKLSEQKLERMTVVEELARKRFEGLQYANQKVGEFLTQIKSSNLKDKVVVALTGDHSYWIAKGVGLEQEFKRYAVPFFISVPEAMRPDKVNLNKFGSHEDIFPTLYHLTLSNQTYLALGENIFEDESHAINSSGLVANEHGAFHHGQYWVWENLEKQILAPANENPDLLKIKKHREGLISLTDLYLKSEKNKQSVSKNDRR